MTAPKLNDHSIHNLSLNELLKFTTDRSVKGVLGVSDSSEVSVEMTENVNQAIANWIVMITVISKDIEILNTVHFNYQECERYAAAALCKKEGQTCSRKEVFGVIKEFCNTVAGYLRNDFALVDIESGFSLPMIAHGCDKIFLRNIITNNLELSYDVRIGDSKFVCGYIINSLHPKKINETDFNIVHEEQEQAGVVELL